MGKFFGTYKRNLDAKKRLLLPSKAFSSIPEKVYLTKGFEGSISLYLEEEFESLLSSLQEMSFMDKEARAYIRLASSSAREVEVDSHGRILLDKDLVSDNHLGDSLVLIGVIDHMEIWDEEAYKTYLEGNESKFEDIAQSIISKKEAK